MKTYAQILAQIPPHLRQYVVDQDYSRYTPVDQATWRFILRQLKNYLSVNAHEVYVEGLAKTGIEVESIPRIEVVCEKLEKFGWTAIPVSGFIPPAAFMELQSLSLLPVACDMRSVDHILYTPAPDIVHEAAGHAPILVDPEFAAYLKEYAQVAKKAIISSEDLAHYEAIRDLSDIKENPSSTSQDIATAEAHLAQVTANISHVSEAALLGRMNWWTAEYGLIGDLQRPKIFGAGLLSSVGEARGALSDKVRKVPLTVDCVDVSYDITEQQPQLFVAETFTDLSKVLKELEDRLSFKRGGLHGLQTAQKAATVNTVELNSGLQISGKLTDISLNEDLTVYYYKFSGPVQLAENGTQLKKHGVDYHAHGFSSPLGSLKGHDKCLSQFTPKELEEVGLAVDRTAFLTFASGVTVEGDVTALSFSQDDHLMLVSFKECTVKKDQAILFDPEWGNFDMAVGSQVVSVFGGPADRAAFGMVENFAHKVIPRKKPSDQEILRFAVFQKLRDLRHQKTPMTLAHGQDVLATLQKSFSDEWLAFIELLELTYMSTDLEPLRALVLDQLKSLQSRRPEKSEYITLGLQLADKIL